MAPKHRGPASGSLRPTPHHIHNRRSLLLGDAIGLRGDSNQQKVGRDRRLRPNPHAQIVHQQLGNEQKSGRNVNDLSIIFTVFVQHSTFFKNNTNSFCSPSFFDCQS